MHAELLVLHAIQCLELDLARFCTCLEMEEEKSEQSEASSTLVVWIDVKERKSYFNNILSV